MSPPRPKRFVAARRFTYRGRRYNPGDLITEPQTIARVVRYGERYAAVVRTPKPAPAEPPTADEAAPPPAESAKED